MVKLKSISSVKAGALFLSLAAPFAACAATDGPAAVLVVVGSPAPQAQLGGEQRCTDMRKVEPSTPDATGRLEIVLSAGKRNWFSLSGEVEGKACESQMSFVPEANAEYAAKLNKVGCVTDLFLLTPGEAPKFLKSGNESNINTLMCATPPDAARLAVFGADSRLSVGQKGYCGEKKAVDVKDKSGITLPAGVRSWVQFSYNWGRTSCELNISFVPASGRPYYARSDFFGRACRVQLFEVQPDGKAIVSPIKIEEERSCLLGKD
jgi:hypothetical protein